MHLFCLNPWVNNDFKRKPNQSPLEENKQPIQYYK